MKRRRIWWPTWRPAGWSRNGWTPPWPPRAARSSAKDPARMLASVQALLEHAQRERHALGAFNVYNLEGVQAVIGAAEQAHSPAILQVHPAALAHGGQPLLALCLAAARDTDRAIGVHLDHAASASAIRLALASGLTSIMADGSQLPYAENVAFSRAMVDLAHAQGAAVEAELGRLAGTEDNL